MEKKLLTAGGCSRRAADEGPCRLLPSAGAGPSRWGGDGEMGEMGEGEMGGQQSGIDPAGV